MNDARRRWRAIGVSILGVTLAQGLLAVTLLPFATSALPSTQPTMPVPAPTPSASAPATATLPALAVLDTLAAAAPTPDGWSLQGRTSARQLGTILDQRCAPADDPVAATVARSRSYAAPGTLSGASVQVLAYPAGLGAKITDQLRTRTKACAHTSIADDDLGWGAESFIIRDNGGRDGSGASGRTVVFRIGDVVGVVAVRSGNAGSLAPQWAADWYATWGSVLTQEICPQQTSTTADADRSPLSSTYQGGWLKRDTIQLDDARRAAADTAGQILIRSKVGAGKDITLPEQALNYAAPLAEIPDYPSTLTVSLPGAKPTKPAAPKFPAAPTTLTTAAFRVADPQGPGCGWAFTGQPMPEFKDAQSTREAEGARIKAAADLAAARTQWWADRLAYATDYAAYAKQADTWNSWANQARQAIAATWWASYDTSVRAYSDAQIAYIAAMAQWKQNGCETPTAPTSPTPAPTVTAQPSSPSCAVAPAAPSAPVEPALPRP